MRRSMMVAAGLVLAVALAACSITPAGPSEHASKADFCSAYTASSTVYSRVRGAPILRWDTVFTSMSKIHQIGTPAGSDGDARNAVLRLSDIVVNSKSEGDARVQVDGFAKSDGGRAIKAMTAYYGPLCAG